MVVRALGALGIGAINQAMGKDPQQGDRLQGPDHPGRPRLARRPRPALRRHRGRGDGPRDKLASGLRRQLGCVWPEADHKQHPGRLILWVGDQDMSTARQPACPLAKRGTVDLFKPVPFGTDQRGRPVTVTLMFTSVIIGAIPRMGKTFLLRLLALIAALDPRAELHLYDFKGTGDLSPLRIGGLPLPGRGRRRGHRLRAGRLPRAAGGAAPPHQGDPRPAPRHCARRTRSPPSWPQEVAAAAPDRGRRR